MMKFKIGDRVRIIGFIGDAEEYIDEQKALYIQAKATITEVDRNYVYPYTLHFDEDELNEDGLVYWKENELTLIE